MEIKGSNCPNCNDFCTLLMVEGVKYFMNEDDDRVHECDLETLI